MADTSTPSLETMPVGMFDVYSSLEYLADLKLVIAEIKTMILLNITDTKSLHALTQASPAMAAVYRGAEKRIMTHATIQELLVKGLQILAPASVIEVRSYDRSWVHKYREAALRSLQHQVKYTKGPIILDNIQCKALLHLSDIVSWQVTWSKKWQRVKVHYVDEPRFFSGHWMSFRKWKSIMLEDFPEELSLDDIETIMWDRTDVRIRHRFYRLMY